MSPSIDPEARKARAHKYHAEHREEILARQRLRRAVPGIREKDRETARAWNMRNPDRIRSMARKYNLERQQRFFDYKNTLACSCCGLTGGHLICFHHRDPTTKESNIAILAQTCFDTPKFWAEIAKCIPLCHNCHATLHYKLDHPEVI